MVPAATCSPANLLIPSLFDCESRPFFAAPPFLRPISDLPHLEQELNLAGKLILQIMHTPQEKIRHAPEPFALRVGNGRHDEPQLASFPSAAILDQPARFAQFPGRPQERRDGGAGDVGTARAFAGVTRGVVTLQEAVP